MCRRTDISQPRAWIKVDGQDYCIPTRCPPEQVRWTKFHDRIIAVAPDMQPCIIVPLSNGQYRIEPLIAL